MTRRQGDGVKCRILTSAIPVPCSHPLAAEPGPGQALCAARLRWRERNGAECMVVLMARARQKAIKMR